MPKSVIISLFALSAAMLQTKEVANASPDALVMTAVESVSSPAFDETSLTDLLETSRIARFTLGQHARSLSSEDLARYEEAFERFLFKLIFDERDRLRGANTKIVETISRSARDHIVITDVDLANGASQRVRWRVLESSDGFGIVDIEVSGLWLAIEQRAQVSSILDRPGATIEQVITRMEP